MGLETAGATEARATETGGTEGTAIGPLHFGHGSVCPSIGSWRTIILLEQCGQASRNGSTGGTEPRQ